MNEILHDFNINVYKLKTFEEGESIQNFFAYIVGMCDAALNQKFYQTFHHDG